MKLERIYKKAIEVGIEKDPRGKERIYKDLERIKKNYEKLPPEEKENFDKEKFINPYTDTRILYGDKDLEIKTILVGIDIEVGEVLLADRLREKGKRIDLLLSHHPEGYALANFYEVMHMQADILNRWGVPINVAEGLLKPRIGEVERKVLPINHNRAIDAAALLDIPFICVHTPADNLVTSYLQDLFEKNKDKIDTVEDVLNILKKEKEYEDAIQRGISPKIIAGDKANRAGKVVVEMTGGTEGAKEAFQKLSDAGVGTIVGMHMQDELRKEAEKYHINVVIAGHIASDNCGLNLFLDELLKEDKEIEILCCSGFRRFLRI